MRRMEAQLVSFSSGITTKWAAAGDYFDRGS